MFRTQRWHQTNSKGKSCPEYKKLQCFQGALVSDTTCKEPLWVRGGVSLDHSDHAREFPLQRVTGPCFCPLKRSLRHSRGRRDYLLYGL